MPAARCSDKVTAIEDSLDATLADTVIDAQGQWVMPGFLDAHTHYDAELLLAPGLPESVRHGVTTVCIGSCSLSPIYCTPEDCADIFSRVEALPREYVLGALEEHKTCNAYKNRFGPRVWHRDLYDALIISAPDPSLAGRSFGAVADERGEHPVDTFLDLVMEHGTKLRWRTTIANHREKQLNHIVSHPTVQIGFADSGAHIRNMAFYNFPLY